MSRWFRHYAGMMRDDKLVRAALVAKQPIERVVWIWGAILESAAEVNDNGRYDMDAAEAAYFLRADEGDIRAVFDALAATGRVVEGRVVNWGARQFQSDRSATRQAAYRERKRSQGSDGDDRQEETEHNERTSPDGEVTASSRHGDAPETETETETESKTKKERKHTEAVAVATRPNAGKIFDEEFWPNYPKREGANPRKTARQAFVIAVKNGHDPANIVAGARRYAESIRKSNQTGTRYVAQAVTWLHQARWEDYPEETAVPTGPPKPPDPSMPSDEELRRKYGANHAESDASTGDEDHEGKLRGEGAGVRAARPDNGEEPSDNPSGNAGVRCMGKVLPGSSWVRAVGDEGGQGQEYSGNDGADAVARVV